MLVEAKSAFAGGKEAGRHSRGGGCRGVLLVVVEVVVVVNSEGGGTHLPTQL